MLHLEYHLHSQGKEVSPTSWSQMKTVPCHPITEHLPFNMVHWRARTETPMQWAENIWKCMHPWQKELFSDWTASVEAKGWADPGIRGWCCHWVWHHSPTIRTVSEPLATQRGDESFVEKTILHQKSHELLCGNGWGQKQTSTKWCIPIPWRQHSLMWST